jgi:hypothetical protein
MGQFLAGLVVGGVVVLGGLAYLKSKNTQIKPMELDSIKLSDVKGEFRKDTVQKKLAENKNLNLFAVKSTISKSGEQYILVRLRFWNSEKNNYENPDLCSFISKNINDDLNAKFSGGSTWTVREAVL